jgi:hypothetical protein
MGVGHSRRGKGMGCRNLDLGAVIGIASADLAELVERGMGWSSKT